jgi:hypothetical protein
MDVKQGFDGTWQVWHGDVLIVGALPSNSAAWAELDKRTARRANWKSSACEFRNLGSYDHGKITPWTNPRARKGGKKRMWRRAHSTRSR